MKLLMYCLEEWIAPLICISILVYAVVEFFIIFVSAFTE